MRAAPSGRVACVGELRIWGTYLSGSYAKHTSIRPVKDEDLRDVDIVVETDHSTFGDSADVIIELRDVLKDDARYESAYLQKHSVGVTLSKLEIDVVPLAFENENKYIGDLYDSSWQETNPKGHVEWSSRTNAEHGGMYKPVVKMMKWWRREHCPEGKKWPKGITLEKMIADCFPDDSNLYEELMIGLLENLSESYSDVAEAREVPFVADPVLESNDLAAGYVAEDFASFVEGVEESLGFIQDEGSNNDSWRKVLGERFPAANQSRSQTSVPAPVMLSVEEALRVPHRQRSRWPMAGAKVGRAIVVADVTFENRHVERISSNGKTIPKGCSIDYKVFLPKGLRHLTTKWLVVNTGEEAYEAGCLRGGFEDSNLPNGGRHECTAYMGRHYVQCLVIKGNRCIARSKEFFIIVE